MSEWHEPEGAFVPLSLGLRTVLLCAFMAVAVLLIWQLAQPLLLILAAIVFAIMLNAGARLLGRYLRLSYAFCVFLVMLLSLLLFMCVIWLAQTQLADQYVQLKTTIIAKSALWSRQAQHAGLRLDATQVSELTRHVFEQAGWLTNAAGSIVSVFTELFFVFVLGVFLAISPQQYIHGAAWLLPRGWRTRFESLLHHMGRSLRRLLAGKLLGMCVEGLGSYILLSLIHVPMAALLGVMTGVLAFLPNIGAVISGALMILVGFSAGEHTGFLTIAIYVFIHVLDGYIIVPIVAKRAVDLAPALVLAVQLLMGTLMGVLGLAMADSIIAIIKVTLEERDRVLVAREGE
jgi:predicted PurR-regulated permease PerM